MTEGMGDADIIFALAATTAIAGLLVAFQAYRGYRRHASRPMLYLASGITLLTVVPAGVNSLHLIVPSTTDAGVLLAIVAVHLVGVVAILYALTKA